MREFLQFFLVIVALCLFTGVSYAATPGSAQKGVVLRVSDGDTIRVRTGKEEVKIRLYGIDAPESTQEGGAEATEFLKDLLLSEQVEFYTLDVDRYERQVAIVVLPNGKIVQDILLQTGLVWVYTKYCKVERCSDWKRMEKQAKNKKIGIWAANPVPPWDWRKDKR